MTTKPMTQDEVLAVLREMRAQLPLGSQDPITFLRKDNPLAARADKVIAQLSAPTVLRNMGDSEAEFIAHHADSCPACGGSGHAADARATIAAWNVSPSADVDWRGMYRFQTAMRYMDNRASLTKETAYRMADEDVASLERAQLAQQGGESE